MGRRLATLLRNHLPGRLYFTTIHDTFNSHFVEMHLISLMELLTDFFDILNLWSSMLVHLGWRCFLTNNSSSIIQLLFTIVLGWRCFHINSSIFSNFRLTNGAISPSDLWPPTLSFYWVPTSLHLNEGPFYMQILPSFIWSAPDIMLVYYFRTIAAI